MSLKSVQNGDEVLRKGPWMPEEDEILVEYVRQFGARDWSSIRTKGLLPRTGKSCRLRWVNKLKPDLKRSGCKFSPEEEKLVVEMQAKLGNKWAKIASCLPGRTDNDVKNFWSTRQKRILRALQRPKMPSGSTDASADTSDLSKDPSLTDFGGFQVHSPSGGASLIGNGMGPHFLFAEGDNEFREDAHTLRSHLHHHHHHHHHRHSGIPSFASLDADDVLTSHKLSEPLSTGELAPYTGEKDLSEMKETKPSAYHHHNHHHHQPLSVALPCATMASRPTTTTTSTTSTTSRSIKRRPRSRRDARATILSCFEPPVLDHTTTATATAAATDNPSNPHHIHNPTPHESGSNSLLPDITHSHTHFCHSNHHHPNPISNPHSRACFTLADSASSQQQNSSSSSSNNNSNNNTVNININNNGNNTGNGNGNGNGNNNNYLEFLLQSDGSLMQSVQIFSPEFPLFLSNSNSNSHQWEKLPMLYSEDASLYGATTKDTTQDSCSPDSVITNFTADVFDSLEPLNSTPSEWWVAQ